MGGRGGSSGLSGNTLPKLEGSEKQVAWAEDIRKKEFARISGYEKSLEDYVRLNRESKDLKKKREALDAEGKTEEAERLRAKSSDSKRKAMQAYNSAPLEYMERVVNNANGGSSSIYNPMQTHTDKRKEAIKKESGLKDIKGYTNRSKAIDANNRKYYKWLVSEYKKVLKSKTSAKWWIDNR